MLVMGDICPRCGCTESVASVFNDGEIKHKCVKCDMVFKVIRNCVKCGKDIPDMKCICDECKQESSGAVGK